MWQRTVISRKVPMAAWLWARPMSRLRQFLESSRLAKCIGQVERGEPVDVKRIALLQALDAARAGELFLLDWIDGEETEDANYKRFGGIAR